jgi:hypothetical protein
MERRDFLFITAAALLTGCAGGSATRSTDSSGMKFSENERKTIEAFYGKLSGTLPAQQVKPGDVLDSGLRPAKLPSDLLARLPDLPAPYTRYTLGADVVLVNRDTHAILDVIPQIAH